LRRDRDLARHPVDRHRNFDRRTHDRVADVGDLPAVFESFVLEQGHGPGPFRLKGIGESGMLAVASAIGNAIEDAVGIRLTQIPFTPERVLRALQEKQRRATAS
jgi:CO/xanthine dehydrogenase Mo-binding subunit